MLSPTLFGDTLSVNQAISIALDKAYAIRIAKNNAEIAKVNTS